MYNQLTKVCIVRIRKSDAAGMILPPRSAPLDR